MKDFEYIEEIASKETEVTVFVDNEQVRTFDNSNDWQRNEFIEYCENKLYLGYDMEVSVDEDEIFFELIFIES